jgi:hypothetical protein
MRCASLQRYLGLFWPVVLVPAVLHAQTTQPFGHRFVATAETREVPESSGVVASRRNPGIYWTHNDSGPYPPRVWAFRLAAADRDRKIARHMGWVELPGSRPVDWEDIAWGPGDRIYLLDGGDNPPCDRTDKRILRFVEPAIAADGPPVTMRVPFEQLRFEYPAADRPDRPAQADAERFDAEALFVDPASEDLYVVTKRRTNNVPAARVYRLPAKRIQWNARAVHVIEFVTELTAAIPLMPTGADVDPDGRRVVIRDYLAAYVFTAPAGEPLKRAFEARPQVVSLFGEVLGEGIAFSLDGRELITTCEVGSKAAKGFPIYVTPVPAPTATATQPE